MHSEIESDTIIPDSGLQVALQILPPETVIPVNDIFELLPHTVFNRSTHSDTTIKYLTFIILGMDGLIFFGTIQTTHFGFYGIFPIANFVFFLTFFLLNIGWLHYKMQHLVMGIYKLFMDLLVLKSNSKYYSGLEVPDAFIRCPYPRLTIQIPVYKEDLENTLQPTLVSALQEARRYTKETGAPCNIIVCDDGLSVLDPVSRDKRKQFYREHGIGCTARPPPHALERVGRFKKAGNLNFSLNYRTYSSTELADFIQMGAYFDGDLQYGPYVFLIDSDTRFPSFPIGDNLTTGEQGKNGCLKRLMKDMLYDGQDSILYSQCFTGPFMSTRTLAEKSVYHFTCHIYNGIMVGTALHSMAPLVGHNALLNMRLLDEISPNQEEEPVTHYKYFWDENRISEDFECMMRGCKKGYTGRYVCSAGIFYEGISFSYMTEYFKVSKFACGAAELTFNPICDWLCKGPISADIVGFILCEKIEWYNKLYIVAYILNFIALAQAHVAAFYNLLFFDRLFEILPFGLLPTNLMWEGMFVWGIINTTISILFAKRLGFHLRTFLKQQLREILFTSALYGSLSVRFSMMYVSHLFRWNVQFGATQKDDNQVRLVDWVRSTRYECALYTVYTGCIAARLTLFPTASLFNTWYYGCVPLSMLVFWYWCGPLVYDILPIWKDKRGSSAYNAETKMFSSVRTMYTE